MEIFLPIVNALVTVYKDLNLELGPLQACEGYNFTQIFVISLDLLKTKQPTNQLLFDNLASNNWLTTFLAQSK